MSPGFDVADDAEYVAKSTTLHDGARLRRRQLVAYIAAFLPVAPYFKSIDSRNTGVCDDQYTSTFESLEETSDEAFKAYLTRKTQGWFRRWGRSRPSVAAASPAPSAAPDGAGAGAGASTPSRREVAPSVSDDEGATEIIGTDGNQASSPT